MEYLKSSNISYLNITRNISVTSKLKYNQFSYFKGGKYSMASILSNPSIREAIHNIARRAERMDSEGAVESFYDCNIISHLNNLNHQIIQGRRGTGKTHTLFVLKHNLESEKCHCIYFDCKTTGSAASISDKQLPENHRSIQLIRDFLFNLYGNFFNYFRDDLNDNSEPRHSEIADLLKILYSECHAKDNTINSYEHMESNTLTQSKTMHGSASFSLSSTPTADLESSKNMQHGQESEAGHKTSGITYRKITFPNIFHCLNRLAEVTGKDFVILIDEWSNIPTEIQPHFAEFLRCCFIPNPHTTLKIAVVRGRTKYCIRNDDTIYGLEIGPDINVEMDLDDLYMCDKDPPKVYANLYKILWKHLSASGAIGNMTVSFFLSTLFKDRKSAFLLVRASEGNPRDFISILNHCILEMDGLGRSEDWIDSETVYNAANEWYHLEKEPALTPRHKKFLSELTTYIVSKNCTRGFIVDETLMKHPAIKGLIDARVLHIAQTGRRFSLIDKQDMAVLVLDFGIYSRFLRFGERITFLTNDLFENEIVPKGSSDSYGYKTHPFDRNRRFLECYFDPILNPNICPTFSNWFK